MRYLRAGPLTVTRSVTCPTCRTRRVLPEAGLGQWARYLPAKELCCSWPCRRTYLKRLRALYVRYGFWGDARLGAFVKESGMLCTEVAEAVQGDLG